MKNLLIFTLLSLFVVACSNQQRQPQTTPTIDSSVDSSVSSLNTK